MPPITSVPLELIALIQESIPDPRPDDLITVGRVCRVFRDAFTRSERGLLDSWLESQCPRQQESREEAEQGFKLPLLHPQTCGTILLDLLTLAQSGAISPANLESILRRAWPLFRDIYLEEALMPLALMIARLYTHHDQAQKALDLLWAIFHAADPFTWSVPPGVREFVAEMQREGREWYGSSREQHLEPQKWQRSGTYPLGKAGLKLMVDTGLRPEVRGEKLDVDLIGFSHTLRSVSKRYTWARSILVEENGAVSKWDTIWRPDEKRLLDDGILLREGRKRRDGMLGQDNGLRAPQDAIAEPEIGRGGTDFCDPVAWPNVTPQPVAAVMKITHWGLQDYRFVPYVPEAEVREFGRQRAELLRNTSDNWAVHHSQRPGPEFESRLDAEQILGHGSLTETGPEGDGIRFYQRFAKDEIPWGIDAGIGMADPELGAIWKTLTNYQDTVKDIIALRMYLAGP
ncbi:uncharacterized protein DSM5745_02693 [Aspergillus mulundensis]|uniref:Uncharacterized protein n=1 Tax=Aspergillus mulundensis TaxID=1810919 RepID=A0A3D8SIP7_9EURO|nr:hypothetical protein DSM5745_02693 [Aspergillus mulundensis]RDW86051.1 hypothetical protein DSM5745_02693 [Aspergillus mulundensis]